MKTGSRKRQRPYVETSAYLIMLARMMRAAADRVADGDVEELRSLLQLRDQLDQVVVEAVAGLRRSGVTWEQIGEAAGTTRQAALMRYGPKIEAI